MAIQAGPREAPSALLAGSPAVPVEQLILSVRGQRVILSWDLARIYGVETRALNQAVKRNLDRFPSDFAFHLTPREALDAVRSRSQSVILKRGHNIKYAPLAFTEHGALMAANVLNSQSAVHMSVFVVRAFLRLREWMTSQADLSVKLEALERHVAAHDGQLQAIVQAIRELVAPPARSARRIGFRPHGSS